MHQDTPASGDRNPVNLLRDAPMSWAQVRVIITTFLLNVTDGFDILAITFAAPGIAREWAVSPASLGLAISAGLAGMAAGSLFLSPLADRFGRRPVILSAMLTITVGMALSAFVTSMFMLLLMRFATGVAIGTMMGPMVIVAAEFANERSKNFCLGLMSIGTPIGGMIGGTAAIVLLHMFDWRAIFIAGALLTSLSVICVFLFLPESVPFLMARRPAGFAEQIALQMKRMGHADIEIPPEENTPVKAKQIAIFDPAFRRRAAILCLIFFGHIVTYYFIVGWMPKMVVDLGYTESQAAGVSTIFNATSVVGMVLLGLIKGRNGLIGALLVTYLASAFFVSVFGSLSSGLPIFLAVAGICGFFASAGVIGTYALVVSSFEVKSRSSGLGLVIGVGRGASALAPWAAGTLFAAGSDRSEVSMIFGAGSALAALGLSLFARQLGSYRIVPDASTSLAKR